MVMILMPLYTVVQRYNKVLHKIHKSIVSYLNKNAETCQTINFLRYLTTYAKKRKTCRCHCYAVIGIF